MLVIVAVEQIGKVTEQGAEPETTTSTAAWVSTSRAAGAAVLVRICRKPSAARRRAKGSRDPVGFSPIEKKADQRVELVGEVDRDRDRAVGTSSPCPAGL